MKFNNNILIFVLLVVVAAISIKVFVFSNSGMANATEEDYRKAYKKNYKIFSAKIPDEMTFAGEKVPLDLYYVREGLDRELLVNSYWQSSTILMLKRSYRYFPVIEPILKKNNIPDDFKYLAVIESGLMNVTSPAGAKGFWQFMKATGAKYGLEINDAVDERNNLEKATEAACQYLKDSYKQFKNWSLAAASYNAGAGGVSSKMSSQFSDNYFDLYLTEETARYVYRILALKLIAENPTEYGFYLRRTDMYPPIPTDELKIDTSITNLPEFAKNQGINYRILKDFNPWLVNSSLPNSSKKTYKILIPKKDYIKYSNLLRDVKDDGLLYNDTLKVDEIN